MRNGLALAFLALGLGVLVEPAAAVKQAAPAAAHKTANVAPAALTSGAARDGATAEQPGWREYEASLVAAMRSSDSPREWALAAIGPQPGQRDDSPAYDPGPELTRAAQGAPDDALVQWLAANNHDSGSKADDARIAAALARLAQLEADNGAIWMLALNHKAQRDDPPAVADALARMADSRRFDDHFVDTAHALFEAYDRHPPPSPYPDVVDGRGHLSATFASAFAGTAAVAMPSYGTLMHTCKAVAARGDAAAAARCATAGRMMLAQGTTLIAKDVGFAMLRNLGVETDMDRALRRDLDWYSANAMKGIGYEDGDAFAARAYETDWRRMNDEVEVIKSQLRRAGLPTEAPPGWQGASSATTTAAR